MILVDGHVLDGQPQGTSTYIVGLYSEIAKRDVAEVLLASADEKSIERWFPEQGNIRWVPLPATNKYRRLAIQFDHLADKYNPDYMHFQYITPLRKRSRWINTVHDVLFLDIPQYFPLSYRVQNRLLFGISARRSDIVLTVSEYSRKAISRNFGISLNSIHVTPCGIDSIARAEPVAIDGLRPGNFFVFVSRFEPRKNQHGLIQALRRTTAALPEGFRLVLVGNAALRYPALDAEIKAAGNLVLRLSNLSSGALTWLYRNAAASFYPSFAEGFGIPPLEAVVAGGRSYCAANTAMLELADCVHGTFDASSIDEMTALMYTALAGPSRESSEALRNRALERYSWGHAADVLLSAIKSDLRS
ncbi:glycosyltransferase family 1 protein [Gemmobacter sp.]|uniref:glycosyltransferase family 4 protein n=1 Tax=Gemmobacter sp. TaxID=1898957 RepID=UPI002AFFB101|nr:glycosyltransferase family 1 protein [Gemmobacter sp.]